MNIIFDIVRNSDGLPYDVEVLVGKDSKGNLVANVTKNVHAVHLIKRYGEEDRMPAGYNAFKAGDAIVLTDEEKRKVRAEIKAMRASLASARAALAS